MPEIISITDKISYIPASRSPLSSDIGLIVGQKALWLFDVGDSLAAAEAVNSLDGPKNAVISHFHRDHMGNLEEINPAKIYLGANTYRYASRGEIIEKDFYIEDGVNLHIFPLPSSHAKGSLGLEVDGKYAFLGDSTYSTAKQGRECYNSSVLKEEIAVLKNLKAEYFLLSHAVGLIKNREEVLSELEKIYSQRDPRQSYIFL
ncbi:MAG: hypothetical protein ACI4IW_04205 [Oscillospiraceae bacterium]